MKYMTISTRGFRTSTLMVLATGPDGDRKGIAANRCYVEACSSPVRKPGRRLAQAASESTFLPAGPLPLGCGSTVMRHKRGITNETNITKPLNRTLPKFKQIMIWIVLAAVVHFTSGAYAAGLVKVQDVTAPVDWCDNSDSHSFGKALALGDFNGDGCDDLAVLSAHAVWIWYSDKPYRYGYMNSIELPYYTAASVMAVDVNGDGYDDLIIGNGSGSGSWVDAYYGSASGIDPSAPSWTYSTAGRNLHDLAAIDANGSGIPGFIASLETNPRAEGFYANSNGLPSDLSPDFLVNGSDVLGMGIYQGVYFWLEGRSSNRDVTRAGVISLGGKFYDQFAVGFPFTDIDQDQDGDIEQPHGDYGAVLVGPRYQILSGDMVQGARFGNSVGNAGDVNGDGWIDLLVGAEQSSPTGSKVFLYLGRDPDFTRINPNYVWSVQVPIDAGDGDGNTTHYFGATLGSAGDINGDGYGDILISDERYDNVGGRSQTNVGWWGRTFIWLGGPPSPENPSGLGSGTNVAEANIILRGDAISGSFGRSFAAGDINGDGFDDLVIGDPRAAGACWLNDGTPMWRSDIGRVCVYLSEFGPPALTINFDPQLSTIRIAWPSPSTGWHLLQCTDLTTPNWVAPPEAVTDNGAEKFIIVNPPAGQRFFRLFKL